MTELENHEKKSLARKTGRASATLFRGLMKFALVLFFIAGGLFVGGFLYFTNNAANATTPANVETADGIVVLTGGPARIAKGLELLAQKKGRRLLISGVNELTKRSDIEAMNPAHEELFSCCVDLEHKALDTVGNATETQKWMEATGYKSIILVTSSPHMPRSMVEFARYMEGVKITPYPVALKELQRDDWWRTPETLRPMVSEYLKFLGAKSRDFLEPDTLQSLRASVLGG